MENHTSNLIDEFFESITPLDQAKTDAKMLIAAKIFDAMEKKGWKKKDLLEAVHKASPSIISKWISGTHNFTIDTMVELEHALDIQLLNLKSSDESRTVTYHIEATQRVQNLKQMKYGSPESVQSKLSILNEPTTAYAVVKPSLSSVKS